ncbi:rubrerythrin family protein [Candidatus Korarchaeum cryptofilum]|uniref:Rubrerythrin family protein n=1 Tax=Candidatus Korarchaeum cryptofilum TaxID=498846 RepID=A0A3R9QQB7_9CREN|nr:rubrerythrin family protein [Candidatus Korarchaeum cryptofilum]RSN68041.1 rubrerythrin family protein [Candidatus Korarchaeum cryptofilum]
MHHIRPMTKDAVLSAFGGESMAHMRYLIFSGIAEKEGFPNVARLFKAIAYAEQVHATNHYNVLKDYKEDAKVSAGTPIGPGSTSHNLELAIEGEEYEVKEMYPVYMELARSQGVDQAERSFKWAYEAEKIHAELYRKAKESVDAGKDFKIEGKVWICPVCGHTYVGEVPPERCPVCGAPKDRYVGF